jgi:hypothetical protein
MIDEQKRQDRKKRQLAKLDSLESPRNADWFKPFKWE